jgi:hypothetical protein
VHEHRHAREQTLVNEAMDLYRRGRTIGSLGTLSTQPASTGGHCCAHGLPGWRGGGGHAHAKGEEQPAYG